LHEHHERNPAYEKVQFSKIHFKLHHYAGVVEYDTLAWLEKNRDPLQADLQATMQKSSHQFIADLFGDEFVLKLDRPPSPGNKGASSSPAPKQDAARVKGAAFITVAFHHKEQLNHLMNTLMATAPHFIRCIIPNHRQKANDLDAIVVLDQLKCNGVLEGIRIARKGFPNRIIYSEFLKRYHLLAPGVPKSAPDAKAQTSAVMDFLKVDKEQFRFGITKIFFRAGQLASIEEMREKKIGEMLTSIQAASRAYLARETYRKLTSRSQAAKIVQLNLRDWLDFKDWMWWRVYCRVKPLIKAKNMDDEINSRDSKIKELAKNLEAEANAKNKLAKDIEDINAQLNAIKDALSREKGAVESLSEEKRKLESLKDSLARKVADLEKDLSAESENAGDLAALKKKTRC
jgi:myosin heavy subunit